MSRCGIVILAAGASTRMGVAKQSLQFEGSSLLLRAVTTALSSTCRPVVVVLGARADELHAPLHGQPVDLVRNANWEKGMGTSVRAGLSAIRSSPIDAAMILLCDQPLISAEILDRMVAAHFTAKKPITSAFYAGTHGTPAIFSASLFDELLALGDNQGGKAILLRHANQVQGFDLPEAEMDVDTAEDFVRLEQWSKK
jgi:molybdenum cofactor cytidylyltransferase